MNQSFHQSDGDWCIDSCAIRFILVKQQPKIYFKNNNWICLQKVMLRHMRWRARNLVHWNRQVTANVFSLFFKRWQNLIWKNKLQCVRQSIQGVRRSLAAQRVVVSRRRASIRCPRSPDSRTNWMRSIDFSFWFVDDNSAECATNIQSDLVVNSTATQVIYHFFFFFLSIFLFDSLYLKKSWHRYHLLVGKYERADGIYYFFF